MPRKPAEESWESFTERQIREAQDRGEFDDLPGAGKPLEDLDRPYDELWWVRRKLKEENLTYIPPALQLKRDVEEARARIDRARSEREVREVLTAINDRIRTANRTTVTGPPTSLMPLDEQTVLARWRAHQR